MAAKTWIIGRSPTCDLVVAQDSVSSRHCSLTQDGERWLLEDLKSTNGTFVEGARLAPGQTVPITRQSRVVLGGQSAMPWPALEVVAETVVTAAYSVGSGTMYEGGAPPTASRAAPASSPIPQADRQAGTIRIGRYPDNDHVIDLPMISGHHARIVRDGSRWILEDTNSRNGVAVNRVENRIQREAIQPTDDIYLGSYKVSASQLLGGHRVSMGEAAKEAVSFAGNELTIGRDPSCDQTLDYPMISWRHAKVTRAADGIYVEDLGSRNGTFVNGGRIATRVKVNPGDQIGLGSFRFQLQDSGALVRREYHGNVTIEASGVSVVVGDNVRLIEPVSFTIYPSELVALMGPAGAGKTTLLKALNGYTPPAEGKVLFNGYSLYDCYDLFRLQMGYVPQDDIVHPQLTVAEALRFSVKLRTDLRDDEIDQRIDKVLKDLGISDKKNTVIGSPERKVLSGGQRKRVNIALELIHDTPVLFLDEPTSGLSSYDAEGVVRLLKRLSTEGKTIITTIHQPSTDMFKEFDNLIMMARDQGGCGALAFFGPAYPDSIQFFNKRPAAEPPKGDLSPEMLLSGLATQPTATWQGSYGASPYRKQFVDDRKGTQPVNSGNSTAQGKSRPFDLRQWIALTRRNAVCKLRDKGQTAILLLQAPLFAVLLYAVIHPLSAPSGAALTGEDLSKKIVIMNFLLVVASIWFGCNNAARDIVGEWSVYQRERMVSLKLPSYVFSKLAVLFAVGVFQCLVMLAMLHVGLGLRGRFAVEGGVLLLANMIGAALGLCLSARAATTESAIALLPVMLLPVIALGGGLQPTYRLPKPVQWVTAVVPSRWAFEANVVEEGRKWDFFAPGKVVPPDPSPCAMVTDSMSDAAVPSVPKFYVAKKDDCSARPAAENTPDRLEFRPSLQFCLLVLGGMLIALVAASLSFLRMRDIQ